MRRLSIVAFVAGLCVTFFQTRSAAQGTSAASITGIVQDASGAVLPGVTVEASSPALIERVRTTVTGASGDYRVIELRPGTYTITFTLPGFSPLRREGLELPPNFTATVSVVMRVGGLEETVTVSGQSPLVDVSNLTQQTTVSNTLLNTVPTAKSMIALASLMPAVTLAPSAQDVGGSRGEASTRLAAHGGKPEQSTLLLDGLSYNRINAPTGRGYMINPLASQEILLEVGSGGSAEYTTNGVVLNMVPRDGANRFSSTLFLAGTNDAMQSNNLTDDLKAQGLLSVGQMNRIYDANVVVSGPIKRDRLWFSTAHRRHGRAELIGNLFYDSDLTDYLFTPDFNRPVIAREDFHASGVRVTWQAATQHKVTASADYQVNNAADNYATLNTGTRSIDAQQLWCHRDKLFQSTWTHPRTNKLLLEAGFSFLAEDDDSFENPCVGTPDNIQVSDTGRNFLYNGQGIRSQGRSYPSNQRFSVSYIAGPHTIKAGLKSITSHSPRTLSSRDGALLPVSYTFNNGVPSGLTQFAAPSPTYGSETKVRPAMGVFVQDQWRIDHLTLSLGLRYEYVRAYAAAIDEPAGLLVDAASYPRVDCLPCWHDINPRVGVAYDLFGTGKTALKASVGRYVNLVNIELANTYSPRAAVVASTTRSWTDLNGNFYPDCNLSTLTANAECGAVANNQFGREQIRTTPDPDWITGWGKRGYAWSATASVDHELWPGVALNLGYHRAWNGNFTVTDNQLVTPGSYDPYCITAPTDPRLPSDISGRQLCGFYDLKPEFFGQVNNQVTLASKFGDQTEVYNGVDFTVNARLPRTMTVGGGWNMGNAISVFQTFPGVTSSKASQCFVVDSPQQLRDCETENPYQSRFKINAAIPLKWDIQTALVYQNLPGPNYGALLTVSSAQIAPSLGRPLAGGTRTVTIDMLPPFKYFIEDRINQVDIRVSKIIRLGQLRLQGNFDIYNLLNEGTVLNLRSQYNQNWLQPTQILAARLFKVGVQLDF